MINIPNHLVVGEPELKWCESILVGEMPIRWPETPLEKHMTPRDFRKAVLMLNTNMAEIRVDRALTLLYAQKRI